MDCLTIEKNSVCRELQGCQKKSGDLQEQMKKMEGDNTELCTQLQHKMECSESAGFCYIFYNTTYVHDSSKSNDLGVFRILGYRPI